MSIIKWEEIIAVKMHIEDIDEQSLIKTLITCPDCADEFDLKKDVYIRDDVITRDDVDKEKDDVIFFCDRCGHRLDHLDHFQQIKK